MFSDDFGSPDDQCQLLDAPRRAGFLCHLAGVEQRRPIGKLKTHCTRLHDVLSMEWLRRLLVGDTSLCDGSWCVWPLLLCSRAPSPLGMESLDSRCDSWRMFCESRKAGNVSRANLSDFADPSIDSYLKPQLQTFLARSRVRVCSRTGGR